MKNIILAVLFFLTMVADASYIQNNGSGTPVADTTSIARDGSRPPSAAQPWNNQDLTGLGNVQLNTLKTVSCAVDGTCNLGTSATTERFFSGFFSSSVVVGNLLTYGASLISMTAASGTDVTGTNLRVRPTQGTGTGRPGDFIVSMADPSGVSGSSVNAANNLLVIRASSGRRGQIIMVSPTTSTNTSNAALNNLAGGSAVISDSASYPASNASAMFNDSTSTLSYLTTSHAGGTPTAPTKTTSGMGLGAMSFLGWSTGGVGDSKSGAFTIASATEDWTTTYGTKWSLFTNATGDSTYKERMQVAGSGDISFLNDATTLGKTTAAGVWTLGPPASTAVHAVNGSIEATRAVMAGTPLFPGANYFAGGDVDLNFFSGATGAGGVAQYGVYDSTISGNYFYWDYNAGSRTTRYVTPGTTFSLENPSGTILNVLNGTDGSGDFGTPSSGRFNAAYFVNRMQVGGAAGCHVDGTQIYCKNGSESSIVYGFTDHASGLYASADNNLDFATLATNAGNINSSQAWTIGTSGGTQAHSINGSMKIVGTTAAIESAQISTPANPASSFDKMYFKSDEGLHRLTNGGIETQAVLADLSTSQVPAVKSSASESVAADEYFIRICTTSNAVSLQLPDPANRRTLKVKDTCGNLSTNNLTLLQFGSENIENIAASKVFSADFGAWTIQSDGTDWWIL